MVTKKYQFVEALKIYVFFQKKFWAKNQNFSKFLKLILFCNHLTQNFMLIPNLPHYFGSENLAEIPKMAFFGQDSPWLRSFLRPSPGQSNLLSR